MDSLTDIDALLSASPHTLIIIGLILVISLLARGVLSRSVLPLILIYMLCGVLLGFGNARFGLLDLITRQGLELLAEVGLVLLLFKVGLESDIKGLRAQLPNAAWIWIWDVLASGALGFGAAYYLLDYSLLTSTFVCAALTATSLGVTVGVWQGAGTLNTPHGQLLIDVAELDDISSIIMLAVLVTMVPVLVSGATFDWAGFGFNFLQVIVKLGVFAFACWGFSVFIEQKLTNYIVDHSSGHEPMVMIMALAFIIAAMAEMNGLSLAIGAFLAGLAFSRDTEAAKEHVVFQGLYDFFTPFFFIGLGLQIPVEAFFTALWPGSLLVAVAIAGKLLGAGLPVLSRMGMKVAVLIGLSMVPRAEIAMVVMQKGMEYGVAPEAFAAMLIVSAVTIILTALVLPGLLRGEAGKQ